MSSYSLSSNRYFDKLVVNRLQAQQIKTDLIVPTGPKYLYSVLLNDSSLDRTESGGTLTFLKSDVENIIRFTDRPLRETDNNYNINTFVELFKIKSNNSFEEDPPNLVMSNLEEQRSYSVISVNENENQVKFELKLLPGQSHKETILTGRMTMFVDSSSAEVNFATNDKYSVIITDDSTNTSTTLKITRSGNPNEYFGEYKGKDDIDYIITYSLDDKNFSVIDSNNLEQGGNGIKHIKIKNLNFSLIIGN